MKKWKQALSVLLAVVMLLCAAPLGGLVGLEFAPRAQALDTYGTCGTNVSWSFNSSTGELTISGSGAMNNYSSYSGGYSPFYDKPEIKSVTIQSGVTSIGNSAFYYCSKLTSVTIPDSMTSIGEYAFYGCLSLISASIPNNVIDIGCCAFYSCSSLTNVTIPNSVKSVGDSAFRYCSKLVAIEVDDENLYYSSKDGVLFNKAQTRLIQYPLGNPRTDYTVSNNVECVEDSAFGSCSKLSAIEVEAENTSYSSVDGVLFNKAKTSLIQYPIGNPRTDYTIPNTVTNVSIGAFLKCYALKNVTIPNSVTSIDNYAFYDCTALTSVTIPDSVSIISYGSFYSCDALSSVTIMNSVTTIEGYAFQYCNKLADIYYYGKPEEWMDVAIDDHNEPLIDANLHYIETKKENENPATCTASGSYVEVIYCSTCDKEIKRTYIMLDPLGHDYQPVYVWADDNSTCTASLVCTRCEDVSLSETVDVQAEVTLKPTCSTEGEMTYSALFNCKAFLPQYKTKSLPVDSDAHVLKSVVTEPTCTDDGYTSHLCTLCPYSYSDTPVPSLGHSWGEPTWLWSKSYHSATATFKCAICKEEKTVGKAAAEVPTPDATCTEDGVMVHTVTVEFEGKTYTATENVQIPQKDHTPDPVEGTAATCTEDGLTEGSVCAVCGAVLTEQESIPASGNHEDADNDGKCDTCEQQMTGGDHCKYCGKIHDGAFGWLVQIFHSIFAIFKR